MKVKGQLKLEVYKHDPHGGKALVDEFTGENLVTLSGAQIISYLMAGEPGNHVITKVGIGENDSYPDITDNSLQNGELTALGGYAFLEPTVIQWYFDIGVTVGNGLDVAEFGLYSEDEQLFARKIRTPAIEKDSSVSLRGYWTIWLLECKKTTFSSYVEIDFNISDPATDFEMASSHHAIIQTDISAGGKAERIFATTADLIIQTNAEIGILRDFVSQADVVHDVSSLRILSTIQTRSFSSSPLIYSDTSVPEFYAEHLFISTADVVHVITDPVISTP